VADLHHLPFADFYRRFQSVPFFLLDRMTGTKHLRVRGMPQVKLAATLKATGLNILRAMAFKNRLQRPKKENKGSNPSPNGIVGVVKEQILQILGYLRGLPGVFLPDNYRPDHFMPQTA
jgi:hypothetical protein